MKYTDVRNVVRLLSPYRDAICNITADNGSESRCHQLISSGFVRIAVQPKNPVCFADSFASRQKGAIENAANS